MHVAISRPDLFSKLLLESPSFYVDRDHILRAAAAADLSIDRVYLGVITNELGLPGCPEHPNNKEAVEDVGRTAMILKSAGVSDDRLKVWTRGRLPDRSRFAPISRGRCHAGQRRSAWLVKGRAFPSRWL